MWRGRWGWKGLGRGYRTGQYNEQEDEGRRKDNTRGCRLVIDSATNVSYYRT